MNSIKFRYFIIKVNFFLISSLDKENSDSDSLFRHVLSKSNNIFTSLIYFLQFYQWYEAYNENESFNTNSQPISLAKVLFNTQTNNLNSYNSPPPPDLPDKLAKSVTYKKIESADLCPLCMKSKTNECVLTVSGFVFCYPCIFKFVQEHQRCPLTKYPASVKNIIRIYDVSQWDLVFFLHLSFVIIL